MQKLYLSNKRQKGAALIIFAVFLALAATAYFIKMLDPVALQAAREDKNAQLLAQAKQALISHSVSRAAAIERPGDMPRPDYFAGTEAPNFNYDGDTDGGCLNSIAANGLPQIDNGADMRCLGRLPWRTIGLTIPNPSETDAVGNMPWYAVSANLTDPTCLTVLNSNTLNLANDPLAALDCTGATLPHPWLTVIDSTGRILSDDVAAVIMLPGAILAGQSRPASPLGGVANYLDAVTVPAGCVGVCVPAGVYSNADFDNIFVISPPLVASSTSNDRLVYITTQELMRAVERRATQEAAAQLRQYYVNSNAIAANRFYPYAANLGDVNNACVDVNNAGLLPILPASANCTSDTLCTTNFLTTTVDFILTSGLSFTSDSGFCSRATGSCVCTGAGNCRIGARRFACTAAGSCESTGAGSAGTFSFTYTSKTPDVTVTSGACAGSAGTVNCIGAAGTFSSPPTTCTHPNPGLATLPVWFTENNWQNLIYYAISSNCSAASTGCGAANLTVGTRNNVHAVVIGLGRRLLTTEAKPAGQLPPSNDVKDYLDSIVNTDGGTVTDPANAIFDATSKMPANDYNDQPLIVAP